MVVVGLGTSTALAATGAAALLVRNASESAAADLSRSELVVGPSPSVPLAGDARRAEHVDSEKDDQAGSAEQGRERVAQKPT